MAAGYVDVVAVVDVLCLVAYLIIFGCCCVSKLYMCLFLNCLVAAVAVDVVGGVVTGFGSVAVIVDVIAVAADVVVARCSLTCPLRVVSDRSGIEDVVSVEQLQENLIRALRSLVNKSPVAPESEHLDVDSPRFTKLLLKLPDLRTLNNMHSEKLLSFRIDV